ncbi:DUF523 and DUF1722 domain-containing protein [Marinicella sp. S1101]|uniref:YbgA family protein n=1 Tax=Marinicella marina TaxID=2996016 RepID=UPI0022608BE8|nr:DUF523 and DUF1722 domain-containing protein [Marinicella marina]MCX7553919.1 DUF523 and DUF1722 domain-containing protein [Marinicella marina]MDJ1140411.1 DUF523 and DUF1722 domain-containing protein [Marinicella marina]
MDKIKVGVSACLLGQNVRYDGGHKHAQWMTDAFSEWFDFQPICPEVEVGLGVPREPINLVQVENKIRVRAVNNPNLDHTHKLHLLADQYIPELETFCGYIFMQKSPSCGLHKVKVFCEDGENQIGVAGGAFSTQVIKNHPSLPVEEASCLADSEVRAHFLTRVFAHSDWQKNVLISPSVKSLKDFHRRYWLLFKAHSEPLLHQLDQLLADANNSNNSHLLNSYEAIYRDCLAARPQRNNHVAVMCHVLNELEPLLQAQQVLNLEAMINQYQNQLFNKSKVIEALLECIKVSTKESLLEQKYFEPYPSKLL